MATCVICNQGGWTGAKYATHKICLKCYRKGYRFGKEIDHFPRASQIEVLKPDGELLMLKSVHLRRL